MVRLPWSKRLMHTQNDVLDMVWQQQVAFLTCLQTVGTTMVEAWGHGMKTLEDTSSSISETAGSLVLKDDFDAFVSHCRLQQEKAGEPFKADMPDVRKQVGATNLPSAAQILAKEDPGDDFTGRVFANSGTARDAPWV